MVVFVINFYYHTPYLEFWMLFECMVRSLWALINLLLRLGSYQVQKTVEFITIHQAIF
ncbi:hypothetical protein NUACC26_024790 [Scytonema sp. NUACC26]